MTTRITTVQIQLITLVIVCIVCVSAGYHLLNSSILIAENPYHQVVTGEILETTTLYQPLPPIQAQLKALSFRAGTYQRINTGFLVVRVTHQSETHIEKQIPMKTLQDNQWFTIPFNPPLDPGRYIVEMTAAETCQGQSVTLYRSKHSDNTETLLIHNGNQTNGTLTYRAYGVYTWREQFRKLACRLDMQTIRGSRLLLSAFLFLCLGGVLVILAMGFSSQKN